MPIAQSKRKLIAATALFVAIGALTGAIATGGAATISFATTAAQQGGGGEAATGQQGGGGGGRTVQEGTVTSSPVPLPGLEGEQRATILPLTEDGSIYSGVLTYTASEPVNVVILNVQNLNETERALVNATGDDAVFGPLLTAQLDNQTSLAIAQITPEYGDSPAPSASIPFAGNAVWLHLAEDTPFVATYAVTAQTQQAETMNNISNLTATAADEEEAAADEEEAAADEEEAAADEEEAAADGGEANGNATNGGAANGNATNGDVDGA
jgi:hypothetical protein